MLVIRGIPELIQVPFVVPRAANCRKKHAACALRNCGLTRIGHSILQALLETPHSNGARSIAPD